LGFTAPTKLKWLLYIPEKLADIGRLIISNHLLVHCSSLAPDPFKEPVPAIAPAGLFENTVFRDWFVTDMVPNGWL